ncbi:MAG TPA: NTP transferase domain-containing protein [Ktedonobacteraceae bacterium]|jgi:2-phospho-L-lactate guanylyltransferase
MMMAPFPLFPPGEEQTRALNCAALVPVKRLTQAKSRLAAHLTRSERETLVLTMLQHVVSTLCESEAFEQVYVVSADAQVLELAQHWGAEALRETRPGHNPALQAAAQVILERAAWRHRVSTRQQARPDSLDSAQGPGLLTISADLPLLSQEDVRALLICGERSQVVLAAASDCSGTNALLLRPPLLLPYLFGPASLSAYIQAARQRGLSPLLLHRAGLAFDVDTREDVHALDERCRTCSPLAAM